eukprot:207422_1
MKTLLFFTFLLYTTVGKAMTIQSPASISASLDSSSEEDDASTESALALSSSSQRSNSNHMMETIDILNQGDQSHSSDSDQPELPDVMNDNNVYTMKESTTSSDSSSASKIRHTVPVHSDSGDNTDDSTDIASASVSDSVSASDDVDPDTDDMTQIDIDDIEPRSSVESDDTQSIEDAGEDTNDEGDDYRSISAESQEISEPREIDRRFNAFGDNESRELNQISDENSAKLMTIAIVSCLIMIVAVLFVVWCLFSGSSQYNECKKKSKMIAVSDVDPDDSDDGVFDLAMDVELGESDMFDVMCVM